MIKRFFLNYVSFVLIKKHTWYSVYLICSCLKNKIKQEMFVKHELPSFEHTLYITQAFIMDCKHGNNFDLLNLKY